MTASTGSPGSARISLVSLLAANPSRRLDDAAFSLPQHQRCIVQMASFPGGTPFAYLQETPPLASTSGKGQGKGLHWKLRTRDERLVGSDQDMEMQRSQCSWTWILGSAFGKHNYYLMDSLVQDLVVARHSLAAAFALVSTCVVCPAQRCLQPEGKITVRHRNDVCHPVSRLREMMRWSQHRSH